MKYLLPIIMLGALVLFSSCGDFYTFEESESTDGLTMRVERDTAYVMVGDRMPMHVNFSPQAPEGLPVYWLPVSEDTAVAFVVNDTLMALCEGEMDMVAFGAAGTLRDTCHVIVIDRWQADPRDAWQDMVYYARVTVGGRDFDPSQMIVAAFNGSTVAGIGEWKEWAGIGYVQLRVFLDTESLPDSVRAPITVRCYDRSTFSVYRSSDDLYFDGEAHGTLSNLLPLNLR